MLRRDDPSFFSPSACAVIVSASPTSFSSPRRARDLRLRFVLFWAPSTVGAACERVPDVGARCPVTRCPSGRRPHHARAPTTHGRYRGRYKLVGAAARVQLAFIQICGDPKWTGWRPGCVGRVHRLWSPYRPRSATWQQPRCSKFGPSFYPPKRSLGHLDGPLPGRER